MRKSLIGWSQLFHQQEAMQRRTHIGIFKRGVELVVSVRCDVVGEFHHSGSLFAITIHGERTKVSEQYGRSTKPESVIPADNGYHMCKRTWMYNISIYLYTI